MPGSARYSEEWAGGLIWPEFQTHSQLLSCHHQQLKCFYEILCDNSKEKRVISCAGETIKIVTLLFIPSSHFFGLFNIKLTLNS